MFKVKRKMCPVEDARSKAEWLRGFMGKQPFVMPNLSKVRVVARS